MVFEVEVDKKSVPLFKKLIANLKDFADQVNFKINEDKIQIQTMDNTMVCLSLLELKKDFFSKYDVSENQTIGVFITVFNKIIKCCNDTETIKIIVFEENTDKLVIINGDNSYTMNLMSIEEEQLEISDLNSVIEIEIKIKDSSFYENIKNIVSNGKSFKLTVDSEKLNILTEDLEENEPESSIVIKHSDNFKIDFKDSDSQKIVKYSSTLINLMIKCLSQIDNEIKLIISDGNLINFYFTNEKMKISYYLAPKLEDQES